MLTQTDHWVLITDIIASLAIIKAAERIIYRIYMKQQIDYLYKLFDKTKGNDDRDN
jgi:hypothetical protein